MVKFFFGKKNQNNWYGINGQNVLRINENGKIKSYSKQKTDYFREKDNLEEILNQFQKTKQQKSSKKI